jgi:O-6-methylguanine DNA methyltransferase
MVAYVVEWDVQLPRGLSVWSRSYSDLGFTIRPMGFRWAVRCVGSGATVRNLEAMGLGESASLVFEGPVGESIIFAYSPESVETDLLRGIARAGGFVLPPMLVREGTMRIRFVAGSTRELAQLGHELGPARLVSRRPLDAERMRTELESLSPGVPVLSDRQRQVLLAAVDAGYYEVPRRSHVGQIAHGLRLGRSTTEEHLRLAESAVIRSAAPLVELARPGSAPKTSREAGEHFATFSSELNLFIDLVLSGDRIARVRLLREAPGGGVLRPHPHLTRILDHLRTGRGDLRDLAVDLRVGAFERRVLEELRRIPSGETRTYGEIARQIGLPHAARAVGNACAHNPVPLVVPCHRVVPARGGIGRYSATGGEATKRRILEREGALTGSGPRAAATSGAPSQPRKSRRVSKVNSERPSRSAEVAV